MDEKLKLLFVISHPTRYAMLKALRESSVALTTAELFERVGSGQNPMTFRYHLNSLMEAGAVESRKRGKGRTLVYTACEAVLRDALGSLVASLKL